MLNYPAHSPKPKDIQSIIMQEEEKQQSVTFKNNEQQPRTRILNWLIGYQISHWHIDLMLVEALHIKKASLYGLNNKSSFIFL